MARDDEEEEGEEEEEKNEDGELCKGRRKENMNEG